MPTLSAGRKILVAVKAAHYRQPQSFGDMVLTDRGLTTGVNFTPEIAQCQLGDLIFKVQYSQFNYSSDIVKTLWDILGSEACKEEYFYALDRALRSRGENYPIIALFPSTVDSHLIPAGIRTRLYVSSSDPDWKERIKAAVERRTPDINKPRLEPYQIRRHDVPGGFLIEIRPRAGSWYPFIVGVPLGEKDVLGKYPVVLPGAPDSPPPPVGGFITSYLGQGESTSGDGRRWWTISPSEEATPTKSFFMFITELPTCVIFGAQNGQKWWVSHYV
jgi:hypothetical protein